MCRAESGSEKANGKADAADDDDGDAEALSTVDLAGVEAKVESRTEVWVRETLLGIIICFAQVPESIAFAYMAHVKAPVALHAAWEIGLVCGIFGGRPGMVNGATGAFAAIINTFLDKPDTPGGNADQIELLFPSVMAAGVFMMVIWGLGLERLLKTIPSPVMIGFCNGLATVIGLAQIHPFHHACADPDEAAPGRRGRRRLSPFDALSPECGWRDGSELMWMLFIALVAMATMEYFPKIPMPARPAAKGPLLVGWYVLIGVSKLPSSFLSIVAALVIEFSLVRPLGYRTDTIGDIEEFTSDDALPIPFFLDPEYDMDKITPDRVGTILLQGALLCCVGSIESLMTAQVVSDFTKTTHSPGMVVGAMGIANVVSGFLGGMGGNAMIGLSTIACLNGGRERVAPVVTAIGVFLTMAVFHQVLNVIPISALTGVMFVVVTHTFKWTSVVAVARALLPASALRAVGCAGGECRVPCCGQVRQLGRFDALIVVVVSVMTVYTNIAYSVILGLLLAHGRKFFARRARTGALGATDSAKAVEMSSSAEPDPPPAGVPSLGRTLSRGMSWVREGFGVARR